MTDNHHRVKLHIGRKFFNACLGLHSTRKPRNLAQIGTPPQLLPNDMRRFFGPQYGTRQDEIGHQIAFGYKLPHPFRLPDSLCRETT